MRYLPGEASLSASRKSFSSLMPISALEVHREHDARDTGATGEYALY